MNRFIAALAACAALGAGAAPPVAIGTLFKIPQHRDLRISPDGKHIAAISVAGGRQNLVVIDIDSRKATPVTMFGHIDVLRSAWVNDKRLAFLTGTLAVADFDARGGVLMAVDIDGQNMRDLTEIAEAGSKDMGRPHRYTFLVRTLPGGTDDIIAQEVPPGRFQEAPHAGDLVRIDTRTGRRTPLGFGKPDSAPGERWVVDGNGVARAMVANGEGTTRIWYRAGPDDAWQKLADGPENSIPWSPLAIGKDGRTLYVASRNGGDKHVIATYDPAKRQFGEVLARHPQVDLGNLVRDRDGSILGVEYVADRAGTAWFDEEMAGVQKTVDTALPDTVNDMSWSNDRSRFLVHAYSDVLPGSYYLLDRKKGRLEWLVDSAPWIDPKQMAHMQPVRYKARDGLEIPAYLTLPRGGDGKNLPMVVVVHGGPWVHGETWRFDPEAQFLASRGYAVLQPNFRGSTGYGWKLYHASFGQWGLAMQDDITDGVRWAVKEGIADAKRVCIYGASYGGYATMMGLAKDPELYRCGVNYVGVTDLNLFLTMTWADYAYSDFVTYSAKEMVGDPAKDAERLRATSPDNLAARIHVPVLMAYGSEDRRVPVEHGTRMRDALEKAGNKPQWILAEGEGHGFRDPKNQEMFYAAMEKFLAENLKPDRPAPAAAR
jgi:dipeptidyl aminopeptidase/acylaminoacyl peptidase